MGVGRLRMTDPVITEERLKSLHEQCDMHFAVIMGGDECSCFCCCKVFPPQEINRWCDNGKTAICPKCGIDSVLPGECTEELLEAMHHYYFCTATNMKTGEEISVCDCQ